MNNIQENTYQNASGKIDYTLMNDYMFRAVLQENTKVLKGLICALLHLSPKKVKSTIILNPIELGKAFDSKSFVLDVKVLLNDESIINLEMQVENQKFWTNRSLSYLCKIFLNLESGDDYSQVKPAYHIGILDFSPFPDYAEFYATYKMTNTEKYYIYNDNFTLNVLDLVVYYTASCAIYNPRGIRQISTQARLLDSLLAEIRYTWQPKRIKSIKLTIGQGFSKRKHGRI